MLFSVESKTVSASWNDLANLLAFTFSLALARQYSLSSLEFCLGCENVEKRGLKAGLQEKHFQKVNALNFDPDLCCTDARLDLGE